MGDPKDNNYKNNFQSCTEIDQVINKETTPTPVQTSATSRVLTTHLPKVSKATCTYRVPVSRQVRERCVNVGDLELKVSSTHGTEEDDGNTSAPNSESQWDKVQYWHR